MIKNVITEKWLLQKLRENMPMVDFSRVENSTCPGMFDVSCACDGDFWLELKINKSGIIMERTQTAWAARRSFLGSRCFVLACNVWDKSIELYLAPFKQLEERPGKLVLLKDKPILIMPKPYNFEQLRMFLRTENPR